MDNGCGKNNDNDDSDNWEDGENEDDDNLFHRKCAKN